MNTSRRVCAGVLLAAGSGKRMGISKHRMVLGGVSVLSRALALMERSNYISKIILVVPADELGSTFVESACMAISKPILTVAGGSSRAESLHNALTANWIDDTDFVAVMDAARPLLPQPEFDAVIQTALEQNTCAFAAIPLADSLHRVDKQSKAIEQIDRTNVMRAATPQVAPMEMLKRAIAHAKNPTDEVSALASLGVECIAVPVSEFAHKLTYPEDIPVMQALAGIPSLGKELRIGEGFDVHRFVRATDESARELVLLGCKPKGLELFVSAHSDGDVAAHALADAVLGTAALGDIGMKFPPSDERFKKANSLELLSECVSMAREAGVRPTWADITIIGHEPKISHMRNCMKKNAAKYLGLTEDEVSIKATTSEGLGITAKNRGIAALAVVLAKVIDD